MGDSYFRPFRRPGHDWAGSPDPGPVDVGGRLVKLKTMRAPGDREHDRDAGHVRTVHALRYNQGTDPSDLYLGFSGWISFRRRRIKYVYELIDRVREKK
jgi:hypothetical protein